MRGSYAQMESRVGARIVPLGTTGNGVRDTCLENEATAQRLRPQANHDNPSWTWEVDNHRLALVLSLWIGQDTQRRLESENKRGAYKCICILERLHCCRGPVSVRGSETIVSAYTIFVGLIRICSADATSTGKPEEFFNRWISHDTWPEWDPDTEWARVNGPVVVGARGVLKPKRGPKTKFIISACAPNREYTDTALLPGARLVFQHTVEPIERGSELRVLITIEGPLALPWTKIMGRSFQDSAQASLDRLVRLVEQP